jgi:hypothetical protein
MPITPFYVHNMRDSSWKCRHEYPLYFLVYTFCDNGGLDGEEKGGENHGGYARCDTQSILAWLMKLGVNPEKRIHHCRAYGSKLI